MHPLRKIANVFGASTLFVASLSLANISGNVYQDFNSNGIRDTATTIANQGTAAGNVGVAVDAGLANVTVNAVCVTNRGADGILGTLDDTLTSFGPVATSSNAATRGDYTITTTGVVTPTGAETTAGKTACRVSFTWNDSSALIGGVPNPLYGMRPAFVGEGSFTATQFVNDGATGVDLGLNYPPDFCQNNPTLAVSCSLLFGQIGSSTIAGTDRVAVGTVPYTGKTAINGDIRNATAPASQAPNAPSILATMAQVGSTWGLAYHKSSRTLLASSYLKRHIGFGPNGTAAIYQTTGPSAGSLFVNLRSLVPDAGGDDPRTTGAAGCNTSPLPATYDFDSDNCVIVGGDLKVGKRGLGDIDISDDGRTLYAIDLANRRLYSMNVGNGATLSVPTSATQIELISPTAINSSTATCSSDADLVPFALKFYRGNLYIGVTCTAESSGAQADLRGFVYRYDGSTFTQVLNQTLQTSAGAKMDAGFVWNPWVDAANTSTSQRPEPLLTDIEFDGDRMVIGLRDRFGDASSYQLLDLNSTTNRRDSRGHGQMYRACLDSVDGRYKTAACATNGYLAYSTWGPNNATPPADPNGPMGGLVQVPGFPDMVVSMKDPTRWYSSGVQWMNNASGLANKGFEFFPGLTAGGAPYPLDRRDFGGKSSSMGDMEALCDAAPIQIGNRVWNDVNGNGLQDPGEPPIQGVTVRLYAPGAGPTASPLAVAITDADGNYYFSNRQFDENGNPIVNPPQVTSSVFNVGGLAPNTTGFQIRFDEASDYSGGSLNQLRATIPNASGDSSNNALTDLTDSDATAPTGQYQSGNYPTITFNTGGPGENNYGLDAGFVQTFSIGNRVWADTNNNGVFDTATETRLDGILVRLTDGAGTQLYRTPAGAITSDPAGNTVAQVLTDNQGFYRFDNLVAGDYRVVVDAKNWTGFTGSYSSGTLDAPPLNVGSAKAPLAGFTSSTPGTNGVTGVTSGPTSTNNNDKGINPATPALYTTAGVSSGVVTVGQGNQPTADIDTTTPTVASQFGPTGDANDNLTVDFGFFKLTVGDTLWYDNGAGGGTRNNGLKDGTEPGVPAGVVVELLKGGVVVASTTTDANGNYIFTQQTNNGGGTLGAPLLPGNDYQVRVPAGQTALQGTTSSVAPASIPAPTSVEPNTNDDGDSGVGVADAFANPTTTSNFTLAVSTSSLSNTPDANGTYPSASTLGGVYFLGSNHKPNVDLGFVPAQYAIGNRIWFDANNNGVKDAGEGAASGVIVELLQGATVVATTATNAQGEYIFDNLAAGNYTVRVAASNWTGITSAQAAAAGNNALTGTRPLAGYNNSTADNAVTANTTVDATDKGIFNATPATNGISSPSITLGPGQQPTGENGTGDNDGASATTAGDANDNMAIDFGFYKLSVGNLVFNDNGTGTGGVVNDGIRNGSEPGIANVTVQLVNSSNVVVAQALTDANGNYSFDQLTSVPAVGVAGTPNGQPIPPGTYTVRIPANQAPLAGLVGSSDPTGGGQPVGDSRDNGVGNAPSTSPINSAPVALQANAALPAGAVQTASNGVTDQPRMDFGLTPGFSLGNRVFLDIGAGTGGVRNDGIQNGTEAGIATVSLNLLDGAGSPLYRTPAGSLTTVSAGNTAVTTVTDSQGYYRFDNLPAGSYVVEVVGSTLPLGAVSSTGTQAAGTDRTDKGLDAPVAGNTRSAPVTLGPGLQPIGEPDLVGSGPGAQGPSGDANTNSTVDFGFVTPIYAIGNRIWFDTNNNATIDASEVGSAGVKVELLQGGTPIAATLTDANGYYLFDNLPAGTYSVRVSQDNWTGIVAATGVPAGAVGTRPLLGYANSSGVTNASATVVSADNNRDHGTDNASPATSGGISSAPLTVGSPAVGSGVGANDTTEVAPGAGPNSNAGDGNDNRTIDFGFYRLTAGNQVWLETNGNSTFTSGTDATPASVQGITVELRDASSNAVIASTTTDVNGRYEFVSLNNGNPIPAGAYYVSLPTLPAGTQPIPVGAVLTDNNSQGALPAAPIAGVAVKTGTFNLAPGVTTENQVVTAATGSTAQPTLDLGFAATYSIGNRVWVDTNNNGTIDGGESGLDGVTVNLRDGTGAQLYRTPSGAVTTVATGNTALTTTTSSGGYYLFTGLPPGSYVVEVVTTPVNGRSYVSSTGINGGANGPYEPIGAAAFANTATNFDHGLQFAANSIRSRPVTLGPGQPTGEDGNTTPGSVDATPDNQSNLTIDFGVFLPASIGTVVWIDDGASGGVAGDGIKQPGEAGIPGVIVTLLDGSGNPVDGDPSTPGVQPVTTTTGPNGEYGFTNLIGGTYQVRFDFPIGSVSTPTSNPVGSGTPPTNVSPGGPDRQFNEMSPTTRVTPVVTLLPGQDNPNLDAAVLTYSATPAPVPTLAEWAKLLLALFMIGAVGLARRQYGRMG